MRTAAIVASSAVREKIHPLTRKSPRQLPRPVRGFRPSCGSGRSTPTFPRAGFTASIVHYVVPTADGISYSACCRVLRVLGGDKFFEKSLGGMSRTVGWLRPTYESVSAKF